MTQKRDMYSNFLLATQRVFWKHA